MRAVRVGGRGDAFHQIQRTQHEVLLDVRTDTEQVVFLELPEHEREQVRLAVLLDLLSDGLLRLRIVNFGS